MNPTTSDPRVPIVLMGVMPPPVHGQALATQAIFEADLAPVEKHLVPIRSSSRMDEVGRASLRKAFGLPGLIAKALLARFRSGAEVLYYTAGSAALVPFIRDIVLLGTLRPFFRRTLIHYHAGGLPDFLRESGVRSAIGRWIYGRGAWALSSSSLSPVPGPEWGAELEIEIPNGIDDRHRIPRVIRDDREVRILFIGNLYEDKGIFDLLEAVKRVAARCPNPLRLTFVGAWPDRETEIRFREAGKDVPANLILEEPAPRYGEAKWQVLAESDVFAFPSYYRSENLPHCIIEAMAAGLPVVAYDWRGMGTLVDDGVTGQMVPKRDIDALAAAIERYASDPDLRTEVGIKARERFEQQFTTKRFLDRIKDSFLRAAAD